ncbi:MAG: hypothetical protein MI785_16985 [Kiloniellales bacterium]|nr:hypothetical protein [Kiloniellales bacterium]
MVRDRAGRRFGRVRIDASGISQRPVLFFFGKPLDLDRSEVTAWGRRTR